MMDSAGEPIVVADPDNEASQVFVAMADGICWDGEEIAGMSPEDARFLAELEGDAPPA